MKLIKSLKKTIFLAFVFLAFLDLFLFASTSVLKRKTINKEKEALKDLSSSSRFDPSTLNCSTVILKDICQKLFLKLENKLNVKTTQTKTNGGEQVLSFELPAFELSLTKLLPSGVTWLTNTIGLVNISIPKPKIILIYGPKNLAARFSTQIDFLGSKATDIDIIGMKVNGSFTVLASISAKFSVLTNVINKIRESKKLPALSDKNPITWFQDSSISLLFASGTVDFTTLPPEFKPNYFNLVSIDKSSGPHAAVQASLKFTENKANPIANFLKTYLFPGEIKVAALLTTTGVSLYCGLADVNVGFKNIVISKAGLSLKFDYDKPHLPTIAAEAEMKIPTTMKGEKEKNIITLSGKIELTSLDVGFDLQMSSIWVNAFGFSRLSFGNIRFKTKFNIQTGIPTSFAFGGEIAIGVDCFALNAGVVQWKGQGHCIKAIGQVGINTVSADDNYYYGDLEPLSFRTIVLAFAGNPQKKDDTKVPDFLENLFKIDKLTASFSTKDVKIGTIQIKKGFLLAGKVTSFSQTCEFNLSLDLSNKLKPTFSFALDFTKPFTFGNAFVLSSLDSKKGPLMKFNMGDKVNNNGSLFSGEFDAKVKILGIEVGAKVNFGKDSFKFDLKGKIFNVFEASLSVESLYQSTANKFKTRVAGEFLMSDYLKNLAQKAAQQAVDYLRELKNQAKAMEAEHSKKLKEKTKGFKFTDVFKAKKLTGIGKSAINKLGAKIEKKGLTALMKIMQGLSDALDIFQLKRISFDLDIDLDTEKLLTQDKDIAKFKATLEAVVFKKTIKKEIMLSIGNFDINLDSVFDAFLDHMSTLFD